MQIERRMWRDMFAPSEIVQLRQFCFTPGRVFTLGKYIAGELANVAFEMNLVKQLPPVRGKNAQIKYKDNS